MPRIITVDPTGAISRIIRSAMDLLDLSIIQVDVPNGRDALEELARQANLVITAFELDEEDDMKGWELAMRIKKSSPDAAVLILGDVEDPDEFDDETTQDSPYVYMRRPVDIHQFLRVMVGGLESHEAMINARLQPASGGGGGGDMDMGPVPNINLDEVQSVLDSLLSELGAMAVVLASREGESLLERGAVGYIDRDSLTRALKPVMMANIGIKDLVGGNVSTVQLYDGEEYDVFVLSVGLHHFVCLIFDGQHGARQFGMVNRYGRKAVEDLIASIGANAFFIQPPVKRADTLPHKAQAKRTKQKESEEPIELARAELSDEEEAPAEPEPAVQLDPIDDLDLDLLFGEGDVEGGSDDLFDMEKLEEMAKENTPQRKGAVSWEDAEQLGLLKK